MERRETKLWSLLRNGTKKFRVHWTRIENLVDSGTPDTWGVYEGNYFPVELKMEESGWVYLRPAQVVWMRMHILAGGQPWIIYRKDDDSIHIIYVDVDFLSLLVEKQKGKYLAFSTDVFSYACFKKPYNYEAILNIIAGKEVPAPCYKTY